MKWYNKFENADNRYLHFFTFSAYDIKTGGLNINKLDINQELIKYLITLGSNKPGWAYTLFDEIISNSKLTFIKDTTMIIHIRTLSINKATILFTTLKELHKLGIAKKVLNKKEYLIIHFNKNLNMCYFENPSKWQSLILYHELEKEELEFKCTYFHSNDKYDLLIESEKRQIFIYTNCQNFESDNIENAYYLGQHLNKKCPIGNFIKYTNQHNKIIQNIKRLLI